MSKDDSIYIGHMLEMSQRAVKAISGKNRKDYDRDDILVMGLAHFIQVIGEAARKVSSEFRETHLQIPWQQAIGMRHRIVHEYMNVDEDVVWEVAVNDLPALIAELEKIVPSKS